MRPTGSGRVALKSDWQGRERACQSSNPKAEIRTWRSQNQRGPIGTAEYAEHAEVEYRHTLAAFPRIPRIPRFGN